MLQFHGNVKFWFKLEVSVDKLGACLHYNSIQMNNMLLWALFWRKFSWTVLPPLCLPQNTKQDFQNTMEHWKHIPWKEKKTPNDPVYTDWEHLIAVSLWWIPCLLHFNNSLLWKICYRNCQGTLIYQITSCKYFYVVVRQHPSSLIGLFMLC